MNLMNTSIMTMANRFRGYLPVVVDVETAGFNAETDALLEVAAVILNMDEKGHLYLDETHSCHLEPFPGANLNPDALAFNGIDPYNPFRLAKPEKDGLQAIFRAIRHAIKRHHCSRAILVGHNAFFDLGFINAACTRCDIKRNPFHPFTTFDTATLGGVMYGQTVLSRIAKAAGMNWDHDEAHSAIYDAEQTAELFCHMVNRWHNTQFSGFSPE